MLDRFSQPERIAGGGALLAIASAFLPWYRFDTQSSRVTESAFGTGFLGDVLFFAAVLTILLLLVRHRLIDVGEPALAHDERVRAGLGAVALGAVVLQMLIGVNGSGAFHHMTVGLPVALLAAGAMAGAGRLRGRPLGHRHSHGLR